MASRFRSVSKSTFSVLKSTINKPTLKPCPASPLLSARPSRVFSSTHLVSRNRFNELEVVVPGGRYKQRHYLSWRACTWFEKN
ncbi:hypothetical protein V6N11_055848 [Hibiscus sabdariffa]|uniref:Uncharacterized protein n=1 Tax=Hibiscus sabdariffa TaxID=183260 RepID=A0ABR2T2W8_9ROSI